MESACENSWWPYPPTFASQLWQVAPTPSFKILLGLGQGQTEGRKDERAYIVHEGTLVPVRKYTPSKQDTVESTRAEGVLLHLTFLRSYKITTETNAAHLSYQNAIIFQHNPRHIDASLPLVLNSELHRG